MLKAGSAIRCDRRLTSREREVLNGVLQSLSNKEIAANLNISERTVKFHVSALLAKFNVADRFSLIRRAMLGTQPQEANGGGLFAFPAPESAQAEMRSQPESPANGRRGVRVLRTVSVG